MRSGVLPCWRKLSAGGKRRSCGRLSQSALQGVGAVQRCGLGILSETCGECPGECRVVCRVAEGLRQLNAVTDTCQRESRPLACCRTAGSRCLSGTTAAAAQSAFRRWPASEIRTLTAARARERVSSCAWRARSTTLENKAPHAPIQFGLCWRCACR
jgi:hypothetical protein